MKSIVTGGTGFIGSNLALELERLGHEVIVVDRNLHIAAKNIPGFRGKILEADVSQSFPVTEKVDFIFHQAAITDPRHDKDEETYEQNVRGFELILNYAQKYSVPVVYASTAGLYGNGPTPMHEDQPKDCLTVYGKSKWKMDQMAQERYGHLHLVGLRYFNVFGPREAHKGRPASMILHLRKQMLEGKPPKLFKWGEQVRDFIYIKDVVRANLLAMTAPNGVYNVGSGVGTTFNELVATLNRVLKTNLQPEYFDMPYDPKTYQHHTLADPNRAKMQLKFEAEWNFESAVRDYHEWLIQHNA